MSIFSVSERSFSFSGKHEVELSDPSIEKIKHGLPKEIHPLGTIVEMVCSLFGLKFETATKDLFTLTHSKAKYECDEAMKSFNAQLGEGSLGKVERKEVEKNNQLFYQYALVIEGEDTIVLGQVKKLKPFILDPSAAPSSIDERYLAIRLGIKDRFKDSGEAENIIHRLMTKKYMNENEIESHLNYLADTCTTQSVSFFRSG